MRIVIYLRVSTENQAKEGSLQISSKSMRGDKYSLEVQREHLKFFC